MADDGKIMDGGTYDTGNRLLCIAVHDAGVEQIDTFPTSSKKESSDEIESEKSDSDEDEDEWHGIEDAEDA